MPACCHGGAHRGCQRFPVRWILIGCHCDVFFGADMAALCRQAAMAGPPEAASVLSGGNVNPRTASQCSSAGHAAPARLQCQEQMGLLTCQVRPWTWGSQRCAPHQWLCKCTCSTPATALQAGRPASHTPCAGGQSEAALDPALARPVSQADFEAAMKQVGPSITRGSEVEVSPGESSLCHDSPWIL